MKFSASSLAVLCLALKATASPVANPVAVPEPSPVASLSDAAEPELEPRSLSSVLGTVTDTLSAVVPVTSKVVGTVGSVVGGVVALLQAQCNSQYNKCTMTVSGEIENMLGDGKDYTGMVSVSAWMQNGHAYGSAKLAGVGPNVIPYNITCDSKANVCLGTLSGNVTQVFANGQQIELWGWLTPEGYCSSGVCYGSITTVGDPGYKA